MSSSDFAALAAEYRRELLDDCLPFWLPRSIDAEQGGFLLMRDRDGSLLDDDKGVWTQARFTWLLGELYNTVESREEWLSACRHGIEFFERCAFDSADGRMWFHLTRDGRPIRKRRYAFTESFAAIAYGECARATGEDWAAEKAVRLFEEFVRQSTDPRRVDPKFTDTRPLKPIGSPMIGLATAQELRGSIQEYWSDMKFWWPHNEAEIACLYAYAATGAARFLERHALVREWSRTHFADPEHGEWYGYLRRDGGVSNTAKGNLWKSPLHMPRMLLVCGALCEQLASRDLSSGA